MVRCVTNSKVTAFGKTREDAVDNLVSAITEYLGIYPEQKDQILNAPIREINIR